MARSKQVIDMALFVTPNTAVFDAARQDALVLLDAYLVAGAVEIPATCTEMRRMRANVQAMAGELRWPELRIAFTNLARVRLHKGDGGYRVDNWIQHGILHHRKRADFTDHVNEARTQFRGESDYTCAFCLTSIATFGWAKGVSQLAPAFVDKLDDHAGYCAVSYLANYGRIGFDGKPATDPLPRCLQNAPWMLVDNGNIIRKVP